MCPVKSRILESARVSCATVRSVREGGNFTGFKSFIMAPHSRRPKELGMGLEDLLLADCIHPAGCFPPPQHLYCDQEGTFVDVVLDAVDGNTKT